MGSIINFILLFDFCSFFTITFIVDFKPRTKITLKSVKFVNLDTKIMLTFF